MKTTITLLLITVTTFSGVPGIIEQEPQKPTTVVLKPILTPMEKRTDSLENIYFKKINIRDSATDQLMNESKRSDNEILKLKAEIKHLKKINHFLKQNIDTVYIHDTIYKRRKFFPLFKK